MNKTKTIRGDILDIDAISKACKDVDIIFHQAAFISVPLSIKNPATAKKINVDGTKNVLDAALKTGVKRIVFASSAAVYGNADYAVKETDPLHPQDPYGESKKRAEELMKEYFEENGLETVCLRYFNVYGPRQNGGSMDGGVASIFLNKFLSDKRPVVTVYGDGQQTRDFVYIKDVIGATRFVMSHETAAGNVYNVATGRETSILNVIQGLETITEQKAQILFSEKRTGDIERSFANISRLRALGFTPQYTLLASLREYVAASGEIEHLQAL